MCRRDKSARSFVPPVYKIHVLISHLQNLYVVLIHGSRSALVPLLWANTRILSAYDAMVATMKDRINYMFLVLPSGRKLRVSEYSPTVEEPAQSVNHVSTRHTGSEDEK